LNLEESTKAYERICDRAFKDLARAYYLEKVEPVLRKNELQISYGMGCVDVESYDGKATTKKATAKKLYEDAELYAKKTGHFDKNYALNRVIMSLTGKTSGTFRVTDLDPVPAPIEPMEFGM
jgi:hypothetical protein